MNMKPGVLTGYVRHPLVDLIFTAKPVNEKTVELTSIRYRVHGKKPGRKDNGSMHPGMRVATEALYALLDGKVHSLPKLRYSMDGYTASQASVVKAAASIPWGTTVSYKELAEMSGHPKAVRAVASVMRNNRFLLVVPCHRVIRSDGSIGGFSGQNKGKMITLKQRLLEREGVVLSIASCVAIIFLALTPTDQTWLFTLPITQLQVEYEKLYP